MASADSQPGARHCRSCRVEITENTARFCPYCRGPIMPGPLVTEDPLIGELVGGSYRIDAELGSGGMGKVYVARHEALDRKVVVKVLHPHHAAVEESVKRFLVEARAASRLDHPHTVRIHDFGHTGDGRYYITMEFLDGESLREMVLLRGDIEPERVANVLIQILEALSEAHAMGVLHRDLKPENIMLVEKYGQKDYVKVLDFGLAKLLDDTNNSLTRAGTVCGTPAYMSPEQASGIPHDQRTDLYSLGAILYEILTGEPPFKAENPIAVLTKHVTEPPMPPSERNPDLRIDRLLEAICLRALAKNPADRYADCAEMIEDLQQVVPKRAPTPTPPPSKALQPPDDGDKKGAERRAAPRFPVLVRTDEHGHVELEAQRLTAGGLLLVSEESGPQLTLLCEVSLSFAGPAGSTVKVEGRIVHMSPIVRQGDGAKLRSYGVELSRLPPEEEARLDAVFAAPPAPAPKPRRKAVGETLRIGTIPPTGGVPVPPTASRSKRSKNPSDDGRYLVPAQATDLAVASVRKDQRDRDRNKKGR